MKRSTNLNSNNAAASSTSTTSSSPSFYKSKATTSSTSASPGRVPPRTSSFKDSAINGSNKGGKLRSSIGNKNNVVVQHFFLVGVKSFVGGAGVAWLLLTLHSLFQMAPPPTATSSDHLLHAINPVIANQHNSLSNSQNAIPQNPLVHKEQWLLSSKNKMNNKKMNHNNKQHPNERRQQQQDQDNISIVKEQEESELSDPQEPAAAETNINDHAKPEEKLTAPKKKQKRKPQKPLSSPEQETNINDRESVPPAASDTTNNNKKKKKWKKKGDEAATTTTDLQKPIDQQEISNKEHQQDNGENPPAQETPSKQDDQDEDQEPENPGENVVDPHNGEDNDAPSKDKNNDPAIQQQENEDEGAAENVDSDAAAAAAAATEPPLDATTTTNKRKKRGKKQLSESLSLPPVAAADAAADTADAAADAGGSSSTTTTTTTTTNNKIAYAFYLGGIPPIAQPEYQYIPSMRPIHTTINNNATKPEDYRGLLYNILVSVKTLKDAGSRADFILLVHMADPNGVAELPAHQVEWCRQVGLRVLYLPPTPNLVNEFTTLTFEKFRILDLIDYARVIYIDPDITPRCNLDYLMESSLGPVVDLSMSSSSSSSSSTNNKDLPLVQPNLIVSLGSVPASSKFFMLAPGAGQFMEFVNLIPPRTTTTGVRAGWKGSIGWGYHPTNWTSLQGGSGHDYSFAGASNDQGILLEWTKYIKRSVTIVVGSKMEHWINGNQTSSAGLSVAAQRALSVSDTNNAELVTWTGTKAQHFQTQALIRIPVPEDNLLRKYSCLSEEVETDIASTSDDPYSTPFGIAPYRDLELWNLGKSYPWNLPHAPDSKSTDQLQKRQSRWFAILQQLDDELQMNLGLSESSGSSGNAWNHIPPVSPVPFNPMWSAGKGNVKALRQWAYRIADTSQGYMSWEPPVVQRSLPSHTTGDNKAKCQCPTVISSDPCTHPTESLEDWLSRRGPHYHLSKQRPLCPHAAKHKMHVLIPFRNSTKQMVHRLFCSAVCQNYPPDKMSIIIFGDGSPKDDAMDEVCGQKEVIRFWPLNDKDKAPVDAFDDKILNHVQDILQRDKEKMQTDASGTNVVCIRSKEELGIAGASYYAFRFIEELVGVNDIVVVAEGGEFSTRNALQIINDKYISKALFTYGGATSNGTTTSSPLTKEIAAGTNRFRPRKGKPSYRFGHPRTFKAFMLQTIRLEDFMFTDGSWFEDPENRGYVFKMMEKAGADRTVYISQPIFQHTLPQQPTAEAKKDHLRHLDTIVESKRIKLPLHIVMMSPDNEDILVAQLAWIQNQTLASKRLIALHVLSHGSGRRNEYIESAVVDFKNERRGKDPEGSILMEVHVAMLNYPADDYAKFHFVQELLSSEPMDSVVFLDKFQYWSTSFLSNLMQVHHSRGVTSWHGKAFSQRNTDVDGVDFGSSALSVGQILKGQDTDTKSFSYSGLDGAVLDINLWMVDQQLLKRHVESNDLWVSYIVDALLGWDIRRVIAPGLVVDISQCHNPIYMADVSKQFPKALTDTMLALNKQLLEENPKAGETPDNNANKYRAFKEFQRKLHWNVARLPHPPLRNHEIELTPISHKFSTSTPLPSDNKSLEASKDTKETTKRAFVCVTGQFSRLELQTKMDHIFKPMQDAGFEVDVALVVSNGTAFFTNAKAKQSNTAPFFTTYSDAVEFLKKNKVNVVSEFDGAYPTVADPPVPDQYVHLLRINQEGRSTEDQRVRAQNHARIFDSYRRCLEYADKVEANARAIATQPNDKKKKKKKQASPQNYYTVFMRIRDDVGPRAPWKQRILSDALPPPPNSIVVTECRSWNGMNDRFAIVSPDVARAYFTLPYELFFHSRHIYDNGAVRNPESFLLYVYSIAKIHVLGHPDLKGFCRRYKKSTGESKFLKDDIDGDRCPSPDSHMQRFHHLYSWAV